MRALEELLRILLLIEFILFITLDFAVFFNIIIAAEPNTIPFDYTWWVLALMASVGTVYAYNMMSIISQESCI